MNIKGIMSKGIAVLTMALLFTVPWFLVGLNIWGWFFVSLCVLLILFELISYKITGKTLSRTFWEFMKANPKSGIAILVSLTAGFAILMLHLLHF